MLMCAPQEPSFVCHLLTVLVCKTTTVEDRLIISEMGMLLPECITNDVEVQHRGYPSLSRALASIRLLYFCAFQLPNDCGALE